MTPPDRLRRSLCLLPLALSPLGCASDPPVPLRTLADPSPCRERADTMMVLLPGSKSSIDEFIAQDYVRTVREQGLAVDLKLVDATVPYYRNRSIVRRLRDDVFGPPHPKRGYRKAWIAGISLGAVGAMLYAREHPEDVDGVVLIAPFLGSTLSAIEIHNAGGLSRWAARAAPGEDEQGLDLTLWRWLKAQVDPDNPKAIPVWLAFGESDRYAFNQRELARALPESRVFTAPGGHDWDAWRPLWKRIVAQLPIERANACGKA